MHLASVAVFFTVLLFFGVALAQTVPPQFKPPVNLGPPINTSGSESDPFWDAPRKRLYFVRDFDIWYADQTETGWANPVKLGGHINSIGGIEQSLSITPDGQKLYFISDARQGFFWDIWASTWSPSTNDWGIPVRLPCPLNTPGEEGSARIASDNRHLYLNSLSGFDEPCPLARCGLYVSEWDGANWSVPQGVGAGSCGNLSDYPTITSDGRWLYYDQFVPDGKSTFVVQRIGNGWSPPFDLRPQIGGRSATPFITPLGDSLFFEGGPELGGGPTGDIFLMERIVPPKVPALGGGTLFLAAFLLLAAGIYWIFRISKESEETLTVPERR